MCGVDDGEQHVWVEILALVRTFAHTQYVFRFGLQVKLPCLHPLFQRAVAARPSQVSDVR